uniref:Uncharacterized protein n=1 Tax=Sciurus vulgaris TaxID=55149 RepID=A0A8D2DA99_SCIVU
MVLCVGDCVPSSNMPSLPCFSVTVLMEVELILVTCSVTIPFFCLFLVFWPEVERYMAHIGENKEGMVLVLVLATFHQSQKFLSTKIHETLQRNADKREWPHITSSIIYSFVNTYCTLLGCFLNHLLSL